MSREKRRKNAEGASVLETVSQNKRLAKGRILSLTYFFIDILSVSEGS